MKELVEFVGKPFKVPELLLDWNTFMSVMSVISRATLREKFDNIISIIDPKKKELFEFNDLKLICKVSCEEMKEEQDNLLQVSSCIYDQRARDLVKRHKTAYSSNGKLKIDKEQIWKHGVNVNVEGSETSLDI